MYVGLRKDIIKIFLVYIRRGVGKFKFFILAGKSRYLAGNEKFAKFKKTWAR